jgi:DNA-binding FadR family transcriptional regulator
MAAILDRQARCVVAGRDIKATDIEFHYAVNAAPGNEIALRLVDTINDLLRGGAPDIGREEDPRVWLAEHRDIQAAIARGDGVEAERAMRAHLEHLASLAPLEEPVLQTDLQT